MNRVRSHSHAKCRVGHAALQAPDERAEVASMLLVAKAPSYFSNGFTRVKVIIPASCSLAVAVAPSPLRCLKAGRKCSFQAQLARGRHNCEG